jgi:hypothetical protein
VNYTAVLRSDVSLTWAKVQAWTQTQIELDTNRWANLSSHHRLAQRYNALVRLASGWTLEHSQINLPNSCLKQKRALKGRFQFLSCSWCRWDKYGSESVFWGKPRGKSDHSEMSSRLHLSWGPESRGAVCTTDNFRPLYWLSHPNDASLRQLGSLHIFPSLPSVPLLQLGQPVSIAEVIKAVNL